MTLRKHRSNYAASRRCGAREDLCKFLIYPSVLCLTPCSNINVFGLALTISVCCLVVAIDLVLLRFLIYLKSFRRALSPRIVRWIDDGLFQIQRKAFEAHGEGTWECLDEVVPVTTTNTELSWGSGPCKCLANSGSGSGTSITANSTGGTADSATVDSNSSDDRQTPVQNSSSPVTTPADPTLVASPTDSSGLVNLVTDDMVIETPTTNIDPGMINPAADDTVMEAPETNINSTPEPERM